MKTFWIAPLTLALAACSGGGDADEKPPEPNALVKVAPVEQSALAARVTLYGAAEPGPGGKLSLPAPAEAVVVAIDAPVGTRVGAGQVVARLKPSPASGLELAKASSDAEAANAALARAQRLKADGLGSNADVDAALGVAKSANATRASLGARAGGMTLRAPAAGVVDTVTPAVGDLVQAGAIVASVSRETGMRVRFGVDPATARTLRPGMPLAIAAAPGRVSLTVPVQSVTPVADPQTKNYSVFANVPPGSGIGIGETLTASVGSASTALTATIPYSALLDDAGQPFVYVVSGGAAHRRDVTPGAVNGDHVAIASGLKPGEQVVIEGGTALEDGMKVRTK